MDRRELLKMIAIVTGGAVVGGELFLTGCTSPDKKVVTDLLLSESDLAYLDEIAETILPATKTPGAKAAKVGQFMITYVNDCYDENDQKLFREGLNTIDADCKKTHDKSFMEATPAQRTEILAKMDKDTRALQDQFKKEQDEKEKAARDRGDERFKREDTPHHPYMLIKQLTLFGYFTSKEVIQGALRFTPVPGKWEACVDYTKGEPVFAGLDGVNL